MRVKLIAVVVAGLFAQSAYADDNFLWSGSLEAGGRGTNIDGANRNGAYGNTKLANVLFTQELNRRQAPGAGLRAFAADPGLVKTDIGLKGTPSLAAWVWKLRRSGGIPASESAEGIVYLLTEPTLQERPEIYWKHGRPQPASRAAQDLQSALRLWQLSEQMCGLPVAVAPRCGVGV